MTEQKRKHTKIAKNEKLRLVIALIVIVWGAILLGPKIIPENKTDVVDCLVDAGAVMYGTDTCPYCTQQKKSLGSAFERITYINCDKDPMACVEQNIKGYPTWIVGDMRLEGYHSPEDLEVAVCDQ